MIIVLGSIVAQPAHRAEALRLSLEHVRRSRGEPGCIDHRVSVDCENELRFMFTEYWQDMDALKAHFALESSRGFVEALSAIVSERPAMKIYRAKEMAAG